MQEHNLSPDVRAALFDLQQYLSDKMPPLMVADAMSVLVKNPPELAAREIHAWVSAQYGGRGSSIPLSDFLYHTLKKLYAIGEFQLLPAAQLQSFLDSLVPIVLELCPEGDRAALERNIALLGAAQNAHAAQVDIIHRQAGSQTHTPSATGANAPVMSEAALSGLRHFSRMLEEWSNRTAGDGARLPIMKSQLVTTAVASSSSDAELDEHLAQMRQSGIDTDPRQLFRLLGDALPPWAAPVADESGGTLSGPAEAMRRIVTMAEGPGEAARRFRQMVRGAIEQFNEGSLARSVTMFELAERIVASHGVNDAEVASIRTTDYESLDVDRLRKYVDTRESHFLLRKILSFFAPYRLDALFAALRTETARDKRRALLAMIEVYGPDARAEALRGLEEMLSSKPDNETHFFARNLLYLLGKLPRGGDIVSDKELDVLGGFSSSTYRAIVVREAVNVLGQTRHERSEKILATRLRDLETLLASGATGRYTPQEGRQLIDRVIAALARLATPGALSAIVEHGLSSNENFGDTRGRLAAIGTHDLAEHPELLARLREAARAELPKKRLGLFTQKTTPGLPKLIEALGGTSAPEARELFEEIIERQPDGELAETARRLLGKMGSAPRASRPDAGPPTLSGDLELLGLPNLLQSLAELQLTGVLTLIDHEDGTASSVGLLRGEVVRGQRGLLTGKEALFQVFEQPRPASFNFVSKKEEELKGDEPPQRVTPIILEAMRRYDELTRARLLIPASASLVPTGTKPAPPPGEENASLVRDVWVRASTGKPPSKWESEIAADSYRIWRLLEHWVDSGALKVSRA